MALLRALLLESCPIHALLLFGCPLLPPQCLALHTSGCPRPVPLILPSLCCPQRLSHRPRPNTLPPVPPRPQGPSFISHWVCPKLSCPFQPLPFPGSLLVGPSQFERLPPAGTLGAPMPLSFVSSCSAPLPLLFPLVLPPSKCRPPCCVPRLSAACLPPSFPSSSAAPRTVLPVCTPGLSHPWLTSPVAPQPSALCLGTTGRL